MSITEMPVETPVSVRKQRAKPSPHGKPTDKQIHDQIVAETGCALWEAFDLMAFLRRAVRQIHHNDGYCHHISQEDLDAIHSVLDVVMPDDVRTPTSGSAHALLNRALLDGDELTLIHTKAGGQVRYCAVTVDILTP